MYRHATATVVALLLWLPVTAFAQAAIGGAVRDASGGVLPGVTVEASSPALIEKVRSVVTDDRGQYLIVDLRPGTYAVTFTLPGFSTVRREGVVVSGAVTLNIDAELAVGAVTETITVSGETPVVDVQTTRQSLVVNREVLDAIPRGINMQATAALMPGVVVGSASNNALQDQGGSSGEPSARLAAFGSHPDDFSQNIEGIRFFDFAAGNATWIPPDADVQEFVFETSAITAEGQSSGVRANIIPREGGNTYNGLLVANFTNTNLTSNNLSEDLRSRGLTSTDRVEKMWDVSPAFGGPIKRDKLWFFASYRNWAADRLIADSFFETNPSKQAEDVQHFAAVGGRITWQASPRNKISSYFNDQKREIPYFRVSPLVSPEAAVNQHDPVLFLSHTKWTSPVTNRLLLEAGMVFFGHDQDFDSTPASRLDAWPTFEITTSKWTGGPATPIFPLQHTIALAYSLGTSASLSYVTGSHAFKVGFQHYQGERPAERWNRFDASLRMNRSVPFEVELYATPAETLPRLNHDLGVYLQDQWTMGNLTLNGGIRFDYFVTSLDAQNSPAGRYVPARSFAAIRDVPNWKDFSPRAGLAWDLFGTGRTALKISVGRYMAQQTPNNFAALVNPMIAGAGGTDRRTWTDRNNNRVPELDELGPSTNRNFGLPVFTVRPDEALREGWGLRPDNWEYTAAVQHEVLRGLSANVTYFHKRFSNLTWTNNQAVQRSDYMPFVIASPLNGEQITLYNLDPAKRGLIDNVIQLAPDDSRTYDGLALTATGRFGRGGLVNSGVTMGRTKLETCTVVDPNILRFCEENPPFTGETTYKVIVAHPLPYDFHVSGVFQSFPGQLIRANYVVTSAIAGVPLTLGSITTNLVEPGELYAERSNRLDVRVTRVWQIGSAWRFEPTIEVFNLLNASPELSVNNTYGPNWRRPTATALGRMLKLGARFDF
jgi:hypothetical protein